MYTKVRWSGVEWVEGWVREAVYLVWTNGTTLANLNNNKGV